MKVIKIFLTVSVCFIFTVSQAQILGRIVDRATDKVSQQLADKLVEEVSNELARVAMKPINQAIDDMIRERYEADSISGKTKLDYSDFATSFLQPVNLPERYDFDITLHATSESYDGEKSEMDMLLSNNGGLLGILQNNDGEHNLMVIDIANDVVAVYNEEDKTVQGYPNMLTLMGAMSSAYDDEDTYVVTIQKTGNTKKVAGYKCVEWEIDEKETVTKSYVAESFPISWQESFTPYIKEVLPATTRDEMPEGMVLKSEVKTKEKNKKSKFEVKKVSEENVVINNSDSNQRTAGSKN